MAPAAEGLSLAATLQRLPDKKARHFLQTGTVPATPPDSELRWDAGVAQPLPGLWTLPLWYLPMGTLAHATQAVNWAFPQPLLPAVALLCSLQAGAAWVRWKEGKGRSSPYFPLVQGQALLHAEVMGTVEWGAIVPGTACRWITAAAPQPMRSPPACHRLLRMVPPLAPQHAFTRDVSKAVLSHTREWLTNPGARYPPGPVLERLTARTPGVLHALHRASAPTEQLNDEVLDLALQLLRVLYPQTHIPPAGMSNRLGRLGLQRRVEAPHPGGVVEQWQTLGNPSTAEGHWYLHQLLFQPRAAPGHRRQNPYHTHPERRGAQDFPQPGPPALLPGQDPEALQQGPPLDTATTVQQRGRDGADGAEPDVTNCGTVAWMTTCRHLARDNTGLRQYRPTDRTALASAVAAVTMGPVAAWPAQLQPHVPCRDTQPRRPAATHAATAPLTAEQLYVVAAALLADGGESSVHHHGPAQIAGSIQGPLRDAPDPWHATLRGRTRVWGAGDGTPPPGPKQGEALVLQTAGYQAILHGHAGGYRSHVLAGGRWTVWHSTARQGAFPPLPHINWQQGPTQAYYMSADPWPLAVLLHTVSAPNKRQEPGWVSPPRTGVEPRLGGASTSRVAGRRHQGHGRPGPPRGANHARPPGGYPGDGSTGTAEPAVGGLHVQPGGRAPRRLRPRANAGARSRDPRGRLHPHDRQGVTGGRTPRLMLQVRLKDNARAARPGVWPAAAHPADLELQLAVLTAVYHWLQAFHDLRWSGKPDRQIGSTHWQTWLQADAQRDAIRSLGPAPATRALDAAALGRTLAPHTVPLANLGFEPAAEGAIRKSVPLPPARGATEPTKCPLCADKYYTSGAMLEHLAWHAVHAAAPADDKEAATNILQGRARRSPWHAPYTRRPPPQAADHADGDEEAPGAAPGTAVRPHQGPGPSPRGWPPWPPWLPRSLGPPCGPRWERAQRMRRTRMPWLRRRTQRRCRCGIADSRRTWWATPCGSSRGTCATASCRQTRPSGTLSGGAGGRRPVPTRSTSSPACYLSRGALPSCSRKQGSPPGRRRCTWPRRSGTRGTPPSSAAGWRRREPPPPREGGASSPRSAASRWRSTMCSVSRKLSPGRPRPWRSARTGEASPSSTSTGRKQAAPRGRDGRRSGPTYKCMPRHAASLGGTRWSSPATPTSTLMSPPTRPRSTSERAGRPAVSEGPRQAARRT